MRWGVFILEALVPADLEVSANLKWMEIPRIFVSHAPEPRRLGGGLHDRLAGVNEPRIRRHSQSQGNKRAEKKNSLGDDGSTHTPANHAI